MAKEAGKRYNITIPHGIADRLERWARIEANGKEGNATGLAGRIVIQAVYDAEQKGILPADDKSLSQENFKLLQGAFHALLEIGDFDGFSVGELAHIIGCEPSDLDRLVDCLSSTSAKSKQPKKTPKP